MMKIGSAPVQKVLPAEFADSGGQQWKVSAVVKETPGWISRVVIGRIENDPMLICVILTH